MTRTLLNVRSNARPGFQYSHSYCTHEKDGNLSFFLGFKKKMDIFQHDGNAYLRSVMAEKLNDKMALRLYQSGPGTFWTNMGNKNMTLMLPASGTGSSSKVPGDEKSSPPAK